MSNAQDFTEATFKAGIAKGVTLVDFWAEWCGPCRMMAPALDQLATEYAGKAAIAKVNVDDERQLAIDYGISAIPALIIFKDGAEHNRFVGATAKTALAKALDAALA